MSDTTPIQTVLQQRDARPVAGEHLEVLGKKAAADWGTGKFASLNEAVVDIVRGERLSPEQVRRVVEFTNGNAYLNEFRKEGSHKVVHFDNGPADPAQVLQDLNDGGGGTVYDRGTLDYNMPPEHGHKEASVREYAAMDKTAAANDEPGADLPKLNKLPSLPKLGHALERHEDALWDLFKVSGDTVKEASANPHQGLVALQQQLHGTRAELQSNLDCFNAEMLEASHGLYHQVKQAALTGATLGELVSAWSVVNDDPLYVKVAFSQITPKLRASGMFHSFEAIGESLLKTAAAGVEVDTAHPAVVAFADFCTALNKVAATRVTLGEVTAAANEADFALKQASGMIGKLLGRGAKEAPKTGGLIGAAKTVIKGTSKAIDSASPHVARALVGAEGAKSLAPTLAKGLKGTAAVGGLLAGNAAVQNVTDRPGVRAATGAVKSVVPGTQEYQQRRYNNMTGQ